MSRSPSVVSKSLESKSGDVIRKSFVTETILYDDEEINENNWRFIFQHILRSFQDSNIFSSFCPKSFSTRCEIRFPFLPSKSFEFPLSSVLCSRIICEVARPLDVANRNEFCGAKIFPTAWQIDAEHFQIPPDFHDVVRSKTFENFSLPLSMFESDFDVVLSRCFLFGPSTHSKIYNFDENFFLYEATIVVFLPSTCSGGFYRFINDDEDFSSHRFELNVDRPFLLVLPADGEHEIEPIEKGFRILIVFHLIAKKTTTIEHFYSKFSQRFAAFLPENEQNFRFERLGEIFKFWKTHLDEMPRKLVVSLQNHFDLSPFFSFLFREKIRRTFELILSIVRTFSPFFLVYSAIFEKDFSSSRIFLRQLTSLTSSTPNFDIEIQRNIYPHEILDDFDFPTDESNLRILVLIPFPHRFDLILENREILSTNLFYVLNLPTNLRFISELAFQFVESILHHRSLTFSEILRAFVELQRRCETSRFAILLKKLLQLKSFRDEFFTDEQTSLWFSRLDWSKFSIELEKFFRQLLVVFLPTKIDEISKFLVDFHPKYLRVFLINIYIRFVFKRRSLPRHIHLSCLCSTFYLLFVDGSFSSDVLLTLAFQIVKRVRKFSSENEIVHKGLKSDLIPLLIQIHRRVGFRTKNSPSFDFIFQFCSNKLNYLTSFSTSTVVSTISIDELQFLCRCSSCSKLFEFVRQRKTSTLIFNFPLDDSTEICFRRTLAQLTMLNYEFQHDPITGEEKTLIIYKNSNENEQKQLAFHLRRLLTKSFS